MTRARVTQSMKAVGRTPWVAYPFALLMFGVFAWRQYAHGPTAETWGHRVADWVPLSLGIVALPALRDLIASGANWGLDFYRRYRAIREVTKP